MRSKFDHPFVGFICGVIFPIITQYVFYILNYDTLSVGEFFQHAQRIEQLPSMISLSVIANLPVFYLFIWKKFYYSARGVIGATFVWVLIVVVQKYML